MTTGIISGTVKVATEDGAPASNSIVRAYDRITGILVTEVTTDVNGEFSLIVPDDTRKYTLTAINNSFPGYNAGIDDNKMALPGTPSTPMPLVVQIYNKRVSDYSTCIIEDFSEGMYNYRLKTENVNYKSKEYYFSIEDSIYGKALVGTYLTAANGNAPADGSLTEIIRSLPNKLVSNISFKLYILTAGNAETRGNSGFEIYFKKTGYWGVSSSSSESSYMIKVSSGNFIPAAPQFTVYSHTGGASSRKNLYTTGNLPISNWYQFDWNLIPNSGAAKISITNISTGSILQTTTLTGTGGQGPQMINELGFVFRRSSPAIPSNIMIADIRLC